MVIAEPIFLANSFVLTPKVEAEPEDIIVTDDKDTGSTVEEKTEEVKDNQVVNNDESTEAPKKTEEESTNEDVETIKVNRKVQQTGTRKNEAKAGKTRIYKTYTRRNAYTKTKQERTGFAKANENRTRYAEVYKERKR